MTVEATSRITGSRSYSPINWINYEPLAADFILTENTEEVELLDIAIQKGASSNEWVYHILNL